MRPKGLSHARHMVLAHRNFGESGYSKGRGPFLALGSLAGMSWLGRDRGWGC